MEKIDRMTSKFLNSVTNRMKMFLNFNPILQGLFQAGSTQGGGGVHKVPAAFFSETVKATAIKLGTLRN